MSSEIVAINTLADNSRFTGAGYQDALITDCLLRQEYAGVKRGLVKSSSAPIGEAARLRRRGQSQSVGGANSKAFLSFLAAAKLGDEEAQVSVGYDYAYGITGKVNVDEALRWWKRAYRQGSWAAAFNLGMFFRDAKQWARALKWFERAVQAGDEDGLIEIAKIHLRYAGDRAAGLHYLNLAVAAKDKLTEPARLETERLLKKQKALSAGDLLYMEADLLHDRGRFTEALPLLLKGAKAGDTSCQILLGNYLSDGRKGIPIDSKRGVYWYKQAYKQGSSTGASNLAMTYRKQGDVDEAYRWFELAAESGDNEAHLALAKIWLHDRENQAKAIKHLKAVFQGNPRYVSEQGRDEARTMIRRLRTAHK
jgi:TPR repeat protein